MYQTGAASALTPVKAMTLAGEEGPVLASGFVARLACRIGLSGAGLTQRPRGVLVGIAEHETAGQDATLHARVAGPVLDPLAAALSLVWTTPASHDYTPVALFAADNQVSA